MDELAAARAAAKARWEAATQQNAPSPPAATNAPSAPARRDTAHDAVDLTESPSPPRGHAQSAAHNAPAAASPPRAKRARALPVAVDDSDSDGDRGDRLAAGGRVKQEAGVKHAAGRGRVKREAEATPLSPEDASPPPGHHAHARRHGGAGVKREDGGGGASASAPRPPSGGLRTFSRLDLPTMAITPAHAVKTALKPHQLAFLRWAKDIPRVVLADEMGLGKTLSVLALSRVSPPPPRWRAAAHERRGGTLVVVPKSLLAQWEAQALQHLGEVHSRGGVLVFYGKAVKHISIKQLCEAEFVLTTYDAMRTNAGARKSAKTGASPAAAAAGGRGGGGKAAGGAAGARKRARAGSDDDDENDDLPLASDESDTDDEGAAARAQRLPSDDGDGDVIVLGSDTEDAEEGCGGGGGGGGGAGAGSDDSSSSDEDGGEYDTEPHKGAILSSLVFHRIVLDECHIIRNPNAQQSMAAFNLHATHRLALSGTPIQNKLEDLFTILRWLRVPAYKLDAPNTAEGSLEARTAWRRQISGPIGCSRNKQGQALAFARLNSLLDDLLIRRTKADAIRGVKLISLAPIQYDDQEAAFTLEEQAVYDVLWSDAVDFFNRHMRKGDALKNYMQILVKLLRARQACVHTSLIVLAGDKCPCCKNQLGAGPDDDEAAGGDVLVAPCGHKFCAECVAPRFTRAGKALPTIACPSAGCDARLKRDELVDADELALEQREARLGDRLGTPQGGFERSTKIDMLLKVLKRLPKGEKSLIFSQWTSFLNILEHFLDADGIRYVRLDGTMSMEDRSAAVESFTHDPSTTIFLLSLKAGGVGLHLVAATHVFLLDPWWNPGVEQQAFERCHRLGQTRQVTVHRLYVANSIEQRIVALQGVKRAIAEGTLTGDLQRVTKTTLDDLKALFSWQGGSGNVGKKLGGAGGGGGGGGAAGGSATAKGKGKKAGYKPNDAW